MVVGSKVSEKLLAGDGVCFSNVISLRWVGWIYLLCFIVQLVTKCSLISDLWAWFRNDSEFVCEHDSEFAQGLCFLEIDFGTMQDGTFHGLLYIPESRDFPLLLAKGSKLGSVLWKLLTPTHRTFFDNQCTSRWKCAVDISSVCVTLLRKGYFFVGGWWSIMSMCQWGWSGTLSVEA